ncbi:alpha/beta fold hydrolase [Rhodanobacter sp. OR87]|uniref:alpha/beta fold hydrolase n=1 Tax=Rhodanobacter sp. OR87 TaxID=1076523 RepID=UPI0004176FB3|nr:alpha/beta fold hydrolase [Rhodanobacter sp. OR87]
MAHSTPQARWLPPVPCGAALECIPMVSLPFLDRDDAGRQLADALAHYRGTQPVVLAIPRGAVPMGLVVADALGGELDVVLVRKLGAPGNPEFAIGAVDEHGSVLLNEYAAEAGADTAYTRRVAQRELALIRERRARYRPGRPATVLAGRMVIVVDDGLATGATMVAALRAVRAQGPARLVCAVPVAAADSLARVSALADEVVCLATPRPFHAVGSHYLDFDSVADEEVIALLAGPAAKGAPASLPPEGPVHIPAGQVVLEGDLVSPPSPRGLVLFVHGSGSSRHSTRNRYVASVLNRRGFSTLLFDLLTPQEDRDTAARFDVPRLARRLDAAVQWARQQVALRDLPRGLFGASTGAAAALMVAAARPGEIDAVVSRGGRPDLADTSSLSRVQAPTLLIVGGADLQVLELNRAAQAAMPQGASLTVVPGATHLFEEPGALEQVAAIAADWFARWL